MDPVKLRCTVCEIKELSAVCICNYPFEIIELPLDLLPKGLRVGDLLFQEDNVFVLDEIQIQKTKRDLFELMQYVSAK